LDKPKKKPLFYYLKVLTTALNLEVLYPFEEAVSLLTRNLICEGVMEFGKK